MTPDPSFTATLNHTLLKHAVGIDESGAPRLNLNDLARMPFFVGSAAVAEENRLPEIVAAFDELEEQHLGAPADRDYELHLRDIIPGKGDFERVPWGKRREFVEGAIGIAEQFEIRFLTAGVHLPGFPEPKDRQAADPYSWLIGGLANLTRGMTGPDPAVSIDATEAQNASRVLAQWNAKQPDTPGEIASGILQFEDSEDNRLIQFADLAAYCHRLRAASEFFPFRSYAKPPSDTQQRRRQMRIVDAFFDALSPRTLVDQLHFIPDKLVTDSALDDVDAEKISSSISAQDGVDRQFDWSHGPPVLK